ncbi:MAG: Rieske (2Fe-2S) protein [Gemmatimonadota bacterium]|nr:Rieske (2Fe-2S) protein [Gemmatimonadota bacterium]
MSRSFERREFVQISACAALGTGLVGCASLAVVSVPTGGGRARLVLRDYPQLASPGGYLRVQPDDLPHHLLVFAGDAGEFTVVSPVCTHRQCIVSVAGPRLVCPCHGSEYERDGTVTMGPAERRLDRYPAEVNAAGELVIDLEAV